MNGRGTVDRFDKRKACVFLILVAIALVCVGVLVYTLFYARPHADPAIQKTSQGMVQQTIPSAKCLAGASTVRS
jgi:hypothetical protein